MIGRIIIDNSTTWSESGCLPPFISQRFVLATLQLLKILSWRNPFSDHMNGHRFTTTVSNPDLPVGIHTQSHQILFQECWSVSVIHKLPDSTPDHIRRQFETAYQLVLQSRHPLVSTSVNPQNSALAPVAIN